MPASLQPGDLVYLYGDRNKSKARDRYLVISVDGVWCNIQKFTGNQLRRTSYRVRVCDCYKVRDQSLVTGPVDTGLSSDEDPDESSLHGPDIPPAISEPPVSPQYPRCGMSLDMSEPVSSPCPLGSEMDQPNATLTPHEAPRMGAEKDSGPLGPVGDPGEMPRRSGRQRRAPDRLVYHW